MTDNEIKRALECCILSECENCPHDEETACKENLNQEILDLINRQQEMIDALIAGQETLQKALAEKNAEIETLKIQNEHLATFWRETQQQLEDLEKEMVGDAE